jgi:hypothetical protein
VLLDLEKFRGAILTPRGIIPEHNLLSGMPVRHGFAGSTTAKALY